MRPLNILVVNGPNLNFLGIREPEVYGTDTYATLCEQIQKKAGELHIEVTIEQSNSEGAIIDRLQQAYYQDVDGIIINPGAYSHYSYAIRDCLAIFTIPKIEVHLSDIKKREAFRANSVIEPVCDKQIYGQGINGYLQALEDIVVMIGK